MHIYYMFFFLFKQKTAYDMRISDWSSDVCSSDLPTVPSATSFEWDEMISSWDRIETLLGGTKSMRMAGSTYLPQHTEESDDNYNERLNVNILFNAMEITLDHYVGRPFSEEEIGRAHV